MHPATTPTLPVWSRLCDLWVLIEQVRSEYPDALPYTPTPEEVKTMLGYFESGQYDALAREFGESFVQALVGYYEKREDYERCGEIMKRLTKTK